MGGGARSGDSPLENLSLLVPLGSERSARLPGPLPSPALWGLVLCLPDSAQYLQSFLGSPCWNCLLPAWASCPGPQEIIKSLRITPETRDTTPTRLSRDIDRACPSTYSSGPEGISSPTGKLKYSEWKSLVCGGRGGLGVHRGRRGIYTARI